MNRSSLMLWIIAPILIGAVSCSRAPDSAEKAPAAASAAASASAPGASAVRLCEHQVPADLCTQCTPALIPAFKSQGDWCAEHGVPESQCRLCHPDLTFTTPAVAKDWCKEHAIAESKCTKCHPNLVAQFIAAGDYCREHGYPASACPQCHPELVTAAGEQPAVFPEPGTKVVLASAQTGREAGIETQRIATRRFARTLDVVGQLEFNHNRHAELSARSEALVAEVKVDIGDQVQANQALIVLVSSAVGSEQARLSAAVTRLETARAAVERERRLAETGVSPKRTLEQAQIELAAAQAEHDAAAASLDAAGAAPGGTGGRYVLKSPFAGTVVARDAVVGKAASTDRVLIEVADLSTMWVQLDVPEADARLVRPGQPVRITFEGMGGETRSGKIARVAASVDPASRTVPARVELPNADHSLKAGVFLRAAIEVSPEHEALVVPQEAVQRAGDCSLVFVKKSDGVYEPVVVELGASTDGWVEILDGLVPGADVVTTGAFLLKTEILKESIGAGCCEVDPKK